MRAIEPTEYQIQVAIKQYLDLEYPNILVHMDLSGVRMPIGLAAKMAKLNNRAWPDIFIAEPKGRYHGLFIELKRYRTDLFTKSGHFRKTQHIQEQREVIRLLSQRGYFACFACGFTQAVWIIADYLDKRKT